MIRVLHVIPSVAPRYGGPSTNIWPMTAALRDHHGLTVELATTDADGPTDRLTPADLPTGAVPVHLLPGVGGDHRPLAAWLAAHAAGYDVIHTHSLWNRHVAAAAGAARRAGVPYVVRPCGMLSGYSWRRSWWKKRAYWWLVERNNVRRAAAVHATSPDEAADVRACGVTGPVYDIPIGIDPAAFDAPPRPGWLRDQCGAAAGERPIVLFLSRLHPKKGVTDFLLPAFARLRTPAFLAIAGGVDETTPGYGDEVRATVERLGLADRVAILGAVQPADRWAAFDGAATFCLPSHSENFGVVVTEALARGCPVVVSEGTAAGVHAVAAGAGRSVRLDPGAVAEALDGFLTDPSSALAAGAAGREYVRKNLAWPALAGRIAEMYRACTT